MCVCVCVGVRECVQVYASVHLCVLVWEGVHGCAQVCVDMHRCAYVCGMNFQNFFWTIESLHQRTLIRILYEFLISFLKPSFTLDVSSCTFSPSIRKYFKNFKLYEPGNRNSALKVQSPLTKVSKAVSI